MDIRKSNLSNIMICPAMPGSNRTTTHARTHTHDQQLEINNLCVQWNKHGTLFAMNISSNDTNRPPKVSLIKNKRLRITVLM